MNVYVFMTDGFETVEALAVIDILRRAQIRTVTVSITGSHHITSSQNITVKADALYEDIDFDKISTDDMLFLPGGAGTANYYKDKALLDLLAKHAENGGWIAAICAAPSVLGRLRILAGKKAVAFPGYEDELLDAQVLRCPTRVVTDGHIITARGMGCAIDLGLEIIRQTKGEAAAREMGRKCQYLDE